MGHLGWGLPLTSALMARRAGMSEPCRTAADRKTRRCCVRNPSRDRRSPGCPIAERLASVFATAPGWVVARRPSILLLPAG
jgi:hypothetical protein